MKITRRRYPPPWRFLLRAVTWWQMYLWWLPSVTLGVEIHTPQSYMGEVCPFWFPYVFVQYDFKDPSLKQTGVGAGWLGMHIGLGVAMRVRRSLP